MLAAPLAARAEEAPPIGAPELGGMLVISTSPQTADDLRLGRISARIAHRGLESFVAADMLHPPPDPEGALVHARWRLDEARRARRLKRFLAAAAAGDEATKIIEKFAFERQHLELLVDALVERGATALEIADPATAETVFLKALALAPLHEIDSELFGKRAQEVFSDVRHASRELRFGSIRIEVARMPGATVAIDFGTPQDAPLQANLPDGRHFVSVSAPSRHEVVAFVPVRAERETALFIRPPLAGDLRARAAAVTGFRPTDPVTIASMARVSGLRFVVTASIGQSSIGLAMHDGRTGLLVPGATGSLSLDPSPDESDAAVTKLVQAATLVEPKIAEDRSRPGWYTTWWGLTLIAIAAAGAAAATIFVISKNSTTDYTFEPER